MCVGLFGATLGCQVFDPRPAPSTVDALPPLPGQAEGMLVTGHATYGAALNSFFGRRPTPVQPIEFPHDIHVNNEIGCTEYCHEGVTKGPVAGLPSITTCMICHDAIATDRPRIQQLAAWRDQGIDLQWQRVYGYVTEAHVRFNHAPHIRAEVECATCHGNIGEQTVAQVNVDLHMGYCVTCHTENNASIDCQTCHY